MQVHVLTGPDRRRNWTDDQKRAIVAAAFAPGAKVVEVARQADINSGLIYRWRKELRSALPGFSEVVVSADTCLTAMPTEPGVSAIEVLLGAQVCARIPLSAPPDLAAAIVKALAER